MMHELDSSIKSMYLDVGDTLFDKETKIVYALVEKCITDNGLSTWITLIIDHEEESLIGNLMILTLSTKF